MLCDIGAGEELTHDYAATSVDQFAGAAGDTTWVLDCQCGSPNCRKKVTGNFFDLPLDLQRQYYPHLPTSIKRKYKPKFEKLFSH